MAILRIRRSIMLRHIGKQHYNWLRENGGIIGIYCARLGKTNLLTLYNAADNTWILNADDIDLLATIESYDMDCRPIYVELRRGCQTYGYISTIPQYL
jgi:hypothetical protein